MAPATGPAVSPCPPRQRGRVEEIPPRVSSRQVLPSQVVEIDVDLFDLADMLIAGMKAVGD
jgi:hypothetical protein